MLDATTIVRDALGRSKRPAVLWSGGKDSGVLLHIARILRPSIEVIHWKLPFLPEKYQFHNKLQNDQGFTTHDWPPYEIAPCKGNGRIDMLEKHSLAGTSITVARGTEPYTDGMDRWVCGKEWLARPKAIVQMDFDLVLIGHKDVDIDPITGGIPLKCGSITLGGVEAVYPLKGWTDKHIASYTIAHGIEYDMNRYEYVNGELMSKSNKSLNSDYVATCMRCINPNEGAFVDCPKLGLRINNVHETVRYSSPSFDYCNVRS